MDLLSIRDLEPPMGDLGGQSSLSVTRALWASRREGEEAAPEHRIIHHRAFQPHGPARIDRVGLRRAKGYHKCGSRMDLDWVSAFRVLAWEDGAWRVLREERDLPPPREGSIEWFDLGGVVTTALILEARQSGIDGWWPGWNLTSGAFVLEGELSAGLAPRCERRLTVARLDLDGCPPGVAASVSEGSVRFRSRYLDVGFTLSRPGFSHLALDERGEGGGRDVLRHQPGSFFQGPQLLPVGSAPVAAWALRYDVEGETRVEGSRVVYDVRLPGEGQRYRLEWEVLEDRLLLRAERVGERPVRAWKSAAWHLGMDPQVAPAHVIGAIRREGETGLLKLPVWLHVPRFGSLRIAAEAGEACWRSDAYRPMDMTTCELKLGEEPQPEGDYLLREGRHAASLELAVRGVEVELAADAPEEVAQAVERCALTALTYRADTATLTNNGASMHCPICMDNWSAVTTRLGTLLPGVEAVDLLRDSLERWLDGGPGYTSGPLLQEGRVHDAEDEYIMTPAAGLLGLADFLEHSGTAAWLDRYAPRIGRLLARTRAYDVDGDGLIESVYRTGVTGTSQWSTCWFDVISFGWKDAFSNALLYPALVRLARLLSELGRPELAEGLDAWAARLRAAYTPAFLNPETGWLAGWRCKEGKLHDYAFPAVNGAAVCGGLLDEALARDVIGRLWVEAERVGMPDPYYGLPVCLHHIPDENLSDIMQGYPLGYYQNAGRTHSQARHFVGALYAVGMEAEADAVLQRLCAGLAHGAVYGGCKSGMDWRAWDDAPCGYEGLLTDQFGVLAVALERYGSLAATRSAEGILKGA